MPKYLLLIISVIFMLGSAILGYMNKEKLGEARTATANAEAAKNAADSQVATTKKSLAETAAKLTAETAKISEMETQLAAGEAEVAKAKGEVTNLTAQLTDKTAALEAAVAEMEKIKSAPLPDSGQTPMAAPDAGQIAELTGQIEALKAEKQIIGDKLVTAESRANEADMKLKNIKNATIAKGLEGQIVAVNQAWGFVVLNLGDRSGVVNNAEMVIMRDGDRIGRVKITSVEPSNSIADIVMDSVSSGQRVLPGDRVIYAGN